MPQPKDFLLFITDAGGRSYHANNGIVQKSGTPTPLPIGPNGIDGIEIKFGRSLRYFGLLRSFVTPLQFVREGAKIIRKIFYTIGVDAILYLLVLRLNKSFGGKWMHEYFYKGELDLSKIEDSDYEVTVDIMEGDTHKLFKANEATKYEIPVDEVIVKMDGISLLQKASFLVTNGFLQNDLAVHTLDLTLLSQESIQTIGARSEARVVPRSGSSASNSIGALWDANEYFLLTGAVDTSVTISWNFQMMAQLASGIGPIVGTKIILVLNALFADNNRKLQVELETKSTPIYNTTLNFTGTRTLTLPADCRIMLVMQASQNRDFTFYTYQNNGTFDIQYTYVHRTTYNKANRPVTMGQRLVDKMMGPGYIFHSTYLSTVWENLLMMSGDAARGFTDPKMKISFQDFYDSYNVPCNLSLSIKDNIVSVERKADAFKPSVSVSLGAGKDLRIKVAEDHQYNTVEIGYPDIDVEGVNGRDEFNVTQTYSTSAKRTVKKLDLISPTKASMYEIELTRINLDGKTTTNSDNDNSNYFVLVEKTPSSSITIPVFYKFLRPAYTSVTGLISPGTAFNLPISPKNCLLNHGDYLRSVLYFHQGTQIKFETSQRNKELKTEIGGVTIEEKANVNVGALPAPLFIPLLLTIESPIPKDIVDIMETSPHGTMQFDYDGHTNYGFVIDTGIKPSENPAMESTLLCSPLTDLKHFE